MPYELSSELRCNELVELVTDYLEGDLPPSERWRFEVHLRRCRGCVTYLAQMRQVVRLTGRLGPRREAAVPAQTRERLLAAFRGWQG